MKEKTKKDDAAVYIATVRKSQPKGKKKSCSPPSSLWRGSEKVPISMGTRDFEPPQRNMASDIDNIMGAIKGLSEAIGPVVQFVNTVAATTAKNDDSLKMASMCICQANAAIAASTAETTPSVVEGGNKSRGMFSSLISDPTDEKLAQLTDRVEALESDRRSAPDSESRGIFSSLMSNPTDEKLAQLTDRVGALESNRSNAIDLESRVYQLEADVSKLPTLSSRVNHLESDLGSRMSHVESGAVETALLESRLSHLESREVEISDLRSRIGQLESKGLDTSDLKLRLSQVESKGLDISDLRDRIANLESGHVDGTILQLRLAQLEEKDADIQRRVTNLDNTVYSI
jgi:BMFP domain-containing protein YqiC